MVFLISYKILLRNLQVSFYHYSQNWHFSTIFVGDFMNCGYLEYLKSFISDFFSWHIHYSQSFFDHFFGNIKSSMKFWHTLKNPWWVYLIFSKNSRGLLRAPIDYKSRFNLHVKVCFWNWFPLFLLVLEFLMDFERLICNSLSEYFHLASISYRLKSLDTIKILSNRYINRKLVERWKKSKIVSLSNNCKSKEFLKHIYLVINSFNLIFKLYLPLMMTLELENVQDSIWIFCLYKLLKYIVLTASHPQVIWSDQFQSNPICYNFKGFISFL